MAKLSLGIDMGGTATRWVAVDETGAVAGRGIAAGANGHLFDPASRAEFVAVLATIRGAFAGEVLGVVAGVTGLGVTSTPDACGLIGEAFGTTAAAVVAMDDIELAYRARFLPGDGHLVAAGTGSVALHITAEGEIVRVGGRGILIDDGGSGSWIALTAIDRLYRRIDETGSAADATILAERLALAVGGAAWDDMRAFVYGGDRGRIGQLAKVVADAALAGDPLAARVLDHAASELARLAQALVARAGVHPVAFVGGVLNLHPGLKPGIVAALPGLAVDFPTIDAALAAAQLARTRQAI